MQKEKAHKNKKDKEKARETASKWSNGDLDMTLVPLGFFISTIYHIWLFHKVRTQPLSTFIGMNSAGRRLWVSDMIKDNDTKNILPVQSHRNALMDTTLMASTSILLYMGLAAVISSTYSVKKPLNDMLYGARGEFTVIVKFVAVLYVFFFAFLCYSHSIRFTNQVNFLINTPQDLTGVVNLVYVSELTEKTFTLNLMGNRLFYVALPLLLWVFGPVLVLFCSVTMVPILYNFDVIGEGSKERLKRSVTNV